jgi:hypothetical protein
MAFTRCFSTVLFPLAYCVLISVNDAGIRGDINVIKADIESWRGNERRENEVGFY